MPSAVRTSALALGMLSIGIAACSRSAPGADGAGTSGGTGSGSLAGSGASSGTGASSSASGGSLGSGGADSGGTLGFGGESADGGSAGHDGQAIAPGTCGVHRRIAVAGVPSSPLTGQGSDVPFIRRVAGRFVVGPWLDASTDGSSVVRWIDVSDDGLSQTLRETDVPGLEIVGLFATAQTGRMLWVGEGGYVLAGYFDEGDPAPSAGPQLLDATFTSFHTSGLPGISLDGLQGSLEGSATETALVAFGIDGQPLGEALMSPLFGDLEVLLPTEHGNALVQIDQGGAGTSEDPDPIDYLHVWELSADGAVLLDHQEPIEIDSSVDLGVTLTDDGFAILTSELTAAGGTIRRLHRVGHDGSSSVADWSVSPAIIDGFAVQGERSLLVHATHPPSMLRVDGDGTASFPLDEGASMGRIHSEPGTLYVDLQRSYSATGEPGREIIEIRCVD